MASMPTERGVALAFMILAQAASAESAQAFQGYRNAGGGVAVPTAETMSACLDASAARHGLDPSLLYLILRVEDGRLGRITHNASGAPPDIGPAQINGIWLRKLAVRWGVDVETTFLRLRDDFCWNIDAAGWIAREALDTCQGRFWECFARYHSRTPHFQRRYLALVAERAKAMLNGRKPSDGDG